MSIQVQPISTPLDLTVLNRDPRILTLRARCRERKQHTASRLPAGKILRHRDFGRR